MAMVLLSMVLLRVNKTILFTNETINTARYDLMATSLGTSVIEEAVQKAFDRSSESAAVSDLNTLTPPSGLGYDAGEDPADSRTFDDFDDYDGYIKTEDTNRLDVFTIRCTVEYVNPSAPDAPAANCTWFKKLTVRVTSPGLPDTLVQSAVFSYWNFR